MSNRPSGWHKSKWTNETIWKKYNILYGYNEYINSKLWRVRRKWLLKRAAGYCEECKEACKKLTPHHLFHLSNDANWIWGHDQPEDFKVICHDCHQKRHKHTIPAWV